MVLAMAPFRAKGTSTVLTILMIYVWWDGAMTGFVSVHQKNAMTASIAPLTGAVMSMAGAGMSTSNQPHAPNVPPTRTAASGILAIKNLVLRFRTYLRPEATTAFRLLGLEKYAVEDPAQDARMAIHVRRILAIRMEIFTTIP